MIKPDGSMIFKFTFSGSVSVNGVCHTNSWRATTHAASLQQARSNLIYRYKKENDINIGAKVILAGIYNSEKEGC